MIVEYSRDSGVCLQDPFDFRRFKLVLKGEPVADLLAAAGIRLIDQNNALVSIALVPTLPGRPESAAWEADYAAMVTSAQKHGWVDVEANAIQAHIERQF